MTGLWKYTPGIGSGSRSPRQDRAFVRRNPLGEQPSEFHACIPSPVRGGRHCRRICFGNDSGRVDRDRRFACGSGRVGRVERRIGRAGHRADRRSAGQSCRGARRVAETARRRRPNRSGAGDGGSGKLRARRPGGVFSRGQRNGRSTGFLRGCAGRHAGVQRRTNDHRLETGSQRRLDHRYPGGQRGKMVLRTTVDRRSQGNTRPLT